MATTDPSALHGKRKKLSEARELIHHYAKVCEPHHVRSLEISTEHLRKVIDQTDCKHVRFYIAHDPVVGMAPPTTGLEQGHTMVMVGVNSAGKNIINGEDDTHVYEDFNACPPGTGDGTGTI